MSMYNATVPQFIKMLDNLVGWLDDAAQDAETRGYDKAVLLEQSLSPDMFNLRRQVQACCDSTKLGAGRLAQVEIPVHEDGEQTWDELLARIASVRAFLDGLEPSAFEGSANAELTPAILRGKAIRGHHMVNQFALPNSYFHFTMAYAVLRSQGVLLGKRKFLGGFPTYDPS
jgi:hypothetical protein